MKIMTGKTGAPHVTSQQFRQFAEATVGRDSYILQSGENLEPELQTNNLLKIRSGMMSHHGNLSVVDIGTYDEVTIANGTQGMQRIDLVVNRYTRNESSGIEENAWVVIQGTPAASNPQVPAHTEGNLQEGDLVDDCPVFEVYLNGINVTEVVKLLGVSPDIPTLNASLSWSDLTNIGSNIGLTTWYRKNKYMTEVRVQGEIANAEFTAGTGYQVGKLPEDARPPFARRYQLTDSRLYMDVRADGGIAIIANTNISATTSSIWFSECFGI